MSMEVCWKCGVPSVEMESGLLQCEAPYPLCSDFWTPIAQPQCFSCFSITLTALKLVDGMGSNSSILQMRKLRHLFFVIHGVLCNTQQNWRDLKSDSETYISRFSFLATSEFIGEKASFHSYWNPFENNQREKWLKIEAYLGALSCLVKFLLFNGCRKPREKCLN